MEPVPFQPRTLGSKQLVEVIEVIFLNFIISHPARPAFSHGCSLPRSQGLFQALTAFSQGSCESTSPSSFGSHQCPLLFLLSFQLNPENFVPYLSGDMGPKCSPTLTVLSDVSHMPLWLFLWSP